MSSLACKIPNLLHRLTFNQLPRQKLEGPERIKHPSRSRGGGGGEEQEEAEDGGMGGWRAVEEVDEKQVSSMEYSEGG